MAQFLSDLINVSSYGKERVNFESERGPLCIYYKDEQRLETIDTDSITPQFKKKMYSDNNMVIWTEQGLREFYHIKGDVVSPKAS